MQYVNIVFAHFFNELSRVHVLTALYHCVIVSAVISSEYVLAQ